MAKLGHFLTCNIALGLSLTAGSLLQASTQMENAAIRPSGCGCRAQKAQHPLPPQQEQKLYREMARIASKNRNFIGGKKENVVPRDCLCIYKSRKFADPEHFIREKDSQGKVIAI